MAPLCHPYVVVIFACFAAFFCFFSFREMERLLRRFFGSSEAEANAAKQTTSSAHAHTIASAKRPASWADTAVGWADAVQN